MLVNRSRIAPRVAILKPLSAAIAIGTGGPFGSDTLFPEFSASVMTRSAIF